jgi:putative oxidoreductase
MTSTIAHALPTSTMQGNPMTANTPFARVCAAGHRAATLLVPFAPLLARLAFGQAFFITGLGKLGDLTSHIHRFEGWGIPFAGIQAPINAVLELVGGIMLMLGLGTRVFAFLLGCTMVVALLTADRGNLLGALPFSDTLANVAPVPFLVALVWLIAYGAGPISIDHFIARKISVSSTSPSTSPST